jgi:hypothetical protein
MKLTSKIINDETKQLSKLVENNGSEIPSFIQCNWLGGLFFFVNAIMSGILESDSIPVGFAMSFFIGLIVMMTINSKTSIYLSVPKSFREQSMLMQHLLHGFKFGVSAFFITIVVIFCVALFKESSIFFAVGEFFLVWIVGFIMCMNQNRYQLSMISSVLNVVRNGKGDSVSTSH